VNLPVTRAVWLALTAVVLLVAPSAAVARTKSVDMGLSTKASTEFQNKYGSDVNDFFLHTVTIRAGDKVRFKPIGFHSVDIPKKGGKILQLVTPTGNKIAGVTDANGAPFWFNGADELGFNPVALSSNLFGKTRTYKGKRIESGLPLAPKPKPLTVKFPKKGTYKYYCDVHPGMSGKVVVKGKHAKIPTAKQDKKSVKKQLSRARAKAKKLAATVPPANTVYTGGSAAGGVEYFGMLPATLTVPAGTTVKFMMSPKSFDGHTATFGPGDPNADPNSYLGMIAASFQGAALDQKGVYPSEQPPSVASFSPTLHGNGFWNSGALDNDPGSSAPASNSLKFDTPGTYDFYCMIHPFMHGQVIVN
jgi:plastocyanin